MTNTIDKEELARVTHEHGSMQLASAEVYLRGIALKCIEGLMESGKVDEAQSIMVLKWWKLAQTSIDHAKAMLKSLQK